MRKLIRRLSKQSVALATVLGFAVIGVIFLLASRAATPTISLQPENATLLSPAARINDAQASGGAAVSFGPQVVTVPPQPTPPPAGSWAIRGVEMYPGVQSVWEKNIRSAPLHPNSNTYIQQWNSVSSNPGIHLAGDTGGGIGSFSFATCYGKAGDPVWTVTGAAPGAATFKVACAPNSGGQLLLSPGDSELVMYDMLNKQMVEVGSVTTTVNPCNQATRSCHADFWNWRNLAQSDTKAGLDRMYNPACAMCRGHRGLDSSIFGFRFEEVKAGNVPHMVKVTLPAAANSGSAFVFPYSGTEGKHSGPIPEGNRIRLKQASYDRLKTQITNAAARTMLDSLYYYGSITSDSGGNGAVMKLENGNGFNWSSLGISTNSLSAVKVTDFEFIDPAFGR